MMDVVPFFFTQCRCSDWLAKLNKRMQKQNQEMAKHAEKQNQPSSVMDFACASTGFNCKSRRTRRLR